MIGPKDISAVTASVVTAAACVGYTDAFDNVTAINTYNFELRSTLLLARPILCNLIYLN